jgi:hypothetical protein
LISECPLIRFYRSGLDQADAFLKKIAPQVTGLGQDIVVRQAHHERKASLFRISFSFALSLSKGKQGVFQQAAKQQEGSKRSTNTCIDHFEITLIFI